VWAAAAGGSRRDLALGLLEAVTYTGEGIYYFLDQFLWWVGVGVVQGAGC
jgi:hypothetical protein